jgi:adenosylcobinamide-GDP ribazoletransferase
MGFFIALRFLTILPLPFKKDLTPKEIGGSITYFPLVGLFLGLLLLGLDKGLGLAFPLFLSSVIVVVTLVLLSGALHLDGLMDSCDALVLGKSPEERLKIMRDSHIGSFGAVGGFSILILKCAALTCLTGMERIATLLLMPIMGRWAMTYSIFAHPYPRLSGMGKAFKDEANLGKLIIATFISLSIGFALTWLVGLGVIASVWVMTAVLGSFLQAKFGGLTGDSYGAIAEVSETTVPFVILLFPQYLLKGGIIYWLHSF